MIELVYNSDLDKSTTVWAGEPPKSNGRVTGEGSPSSREFRAARLIRQNGTGNWARVLPPPIDSIDKSSGQNHRCDSGLQA